jgi:hypothetical protein
MARQINRRLSGLILGLYARTTILSNKSKDVGKYKKRLVFVETRSDSGEGPKQGAQLGPGLTVKESGRRHGFE